MISERNSEVMKLGVRVYRLFLLFLYIGITSVKLNSAAYYKGCLMSLCI